MPTRRGIVPTTTVPEKLPHSVKGAVVDASGDPQKPVWTLRRSKGRGQVVSGDELTLEAGGKFMSVFDDAVVALEKPLANCKFIIEIKEHPAPMRVGFTGMLNEGFENVEWFGRGPHESYVDRYVSARVGLHEGTIADQTFKYVRPQENGNKFDTRWMALKRAGSKADACSMLVLAATQPSQTLEMQCHHYALSDFDGGEEKVKQPYLHAGELVERAETTFCVDALQMGVGGIDSWGRKPLPEHMIGGAQQFDFGFKLIALSSEESEEKVGDDWRHWLRRP